MAELEELSLIRHFLGEPSLEIFLQKSWGSEFTSHREQIHNELLKHTKFVDTSISHTREMGGYVGICSSDKFKKHIGFDIEATSRVTQAIARRVCLTQEEFDQAPSPAHLWVAKEAAFKALRGCGQPKTVSKIEISDWVEYKSQIWGFRLHNWREFNLCDANGVILSKENLMFGYFIVTF